ncbi:unnamed protein product [Miscanthus lutarioriparius]|uniref:Pentatricopeptide repeat-containing protein n=1 Tax=Miscanthus lutarioriparius TaxID=422564 RepID=A0A811N104_9POAL|nr:unnamed protein product [Miscanthus lutarioriparius]
MPGANPAGQVFDETPLLRGICYVLGQTTALVVSDYQVLHPSPPRCSLDRLVYKEGALQWRRRRRRQCHSRDIWPAVRAVLAGPVHVAAGVIGRALERGQSSDSLELELERLHVDLDPFVVNRVLRSVSDSETAVRFYWWAESRPGFDHTQFAIAYIVSLLFIDINFFLLSEFLERMLDNMEMRGTSPDVVTYTTVVGFLCDNKQFAEAVELWEEMSDKAHEAFELALRMLSLNLELNVCIYNALISGFLRSGSINKAFKIISFMRTNGCEPDVVTYNIRLNHYCDAGMIKEAEKLIEEMEMSGVVNPDRYSYNQMLKGLCKAHQLDRAFGFVSDHMEVGGFCDIVSCNILIDAFCKAKKVTSALKLFKEMGYKGIQADAVTYGTLINGLYGVGYYNLAEEIFEQMLKAQVVPNVNLYNIMLHNLCKAGQFEQAQKIFLQMIKKEVSPDIITFNTLIYWLGKSSRAIEAVDLFRDMRARGVEPDSLTFRYLINGLLEEGKATLAYEVWEYMMENGIILDRDVSDRLITGPGPDPKADTPEKQWTSHATVVEQVSQEMLIPG